MSGWVGNVCFLLFKSEMKEAAVSRQRCCAATRTKVAHGLVSLGIADDLSYTHVEITEDKKCARIRTGIWSQILRIILKLAGTGARHRQQRPDRPICRKRHRLNIFKAFTIETPTSRESLIILDVGIR